MSDVLPYRGPFLGTEIDAAIHAIRGEGTVIAPLRLSSGTKTAPGLTFGSELTSGLYRAGAGDIRLSVLDQDIAVFGKVAGSAALGIGTVPSVNFHIKRDIAGNFTPWLAENADTTDGNAVLLEHRSTTTGVGAAAFQPFCWIAMSALVHDHPTRTASLTFNWVDAGTFRNIAILGDGIIRKGTGNLQLLSNAGNGSIILTPNGTGRVQLGLDGTVALPGLTFTSETSSGLYRAGAGDVRISILNTDVARFTREANLGSATNVPSLRVGPATAVGQFQLSCSSSSTFNQFLMNNPDTTNSVESVIGFTTTTTGAGAAVNTRVAYFSFACTQHDHATRNGWASILWLNSAAALWVTWSGAAYAPGTTNAIDLGTSSLKWRSIYWATQSLAPDGSIGTPARSYASETTSGWYRAGAGDVRHVILGTDVMFLARTSPTGLTNAPSLGIGTVPTRPFHILSAVTGANVINQVVMENTGTSDGNGLQLVAWGTTTGVGATTQVQFGAISFIYDLHDHPTRVGYLQFSSTDAGVSTTLRWRGGALQKVTGNFTLSSLAGNGDIVLTANGTGRVNVSGGSGKIGVNTIEASTGASILFDGTLQMPIGANRFIRFTAGTNQRAGDAVLVAGTITVGCTSVSANTRIYLTPKTLGGTPGFLSYTLNAGVGFTINSSNAADTSTISFILFEVS